MTEAEKKLRKQYSKERKRVQKIIKNTGKDITIPKLKELTTGEIKTGLKQLKKIHSREKIYNFTNLRSTKTRDEVDSKFYSKDTGGRYENVVTEIPSFDPNVNQTDLFLEFFDDSDKNLKKTADGAPIMLSFYNDMYDAFLNEKYNDFVNEPANKGLKKDQILNLWQEYRETHASEIENAYKKKFGLWLELVFGGAGRYSYGEFYSDVWARRYIAQFIPYMGDPYREAFEKVNEENDNFYTVDTEE